MKHMSVQTDPTFAAGAAEAAAADGTNTPPPATPEPQSTIVEPGAVAPVAGGTYTAEDIERARQEEKDKLYRRLDKTNERLAELERERQARIEEQQAAQAAAEEAERKRQEEELSAKELLQKQREEFNAKFAALEAEREAERALLERERQYNEIVQYAAEQRMANQEDILPELLDFVRGSSREEIDQAVITLRERTATILGNVTAAGQAQRQQQKGPSVTAPPVGPSDTQTSTQTFSAADIAAMDMATYAANRDRLLGATGVRVREQGLYG